MAKGNDQIFALLAEMRADTKSDIADLRRLVDSLRTDMVEIKTQRKLMIWLAGALGGVASYLINHFPFSRFL